jgi:hypothetical protein
MSNSGAKRLKEVEKQNNRIQKDADSNIEAALAQKGRWHDGLD